MNIQDECIKIHSKFGMSEMANYKIQLLFDSEIEKVKKEYEEKLRWIPVTEDLPDKDNYTQCLWKNEKGEIWFGMARESQKPTHWKHCFL